VLPFGAMRSFARIPKAALLAIVAAATAAGLGLAVSALPQPDLGLHLAYQDGQVVVASVDYGSMAQVSGLRSGQVVVMIDDQYVLGASESVKRAAAQSAVPWMGLMTAPRDLLICDGGSTCTLAPPYEFRLGYSNGVPYYSWGGPAEAWHDFQSYPYGSAPIEAGWAILILGWLVLSRGWAGPTLRPFALSLPVATAVPLFFVSIDTYHSAPAAVAGAILVPLAVLPLAIDFLRRIEGKRRRRLVASVTAGLALASVVTGLILPTNQDLLTWRIALVALTAFVPGLFAARLFHRRESGSNPAPSRWRAILARGLEFVPGSFAGCLTRRLRSASTAGSGSTPGVVVGSVDVMFAAITPGIAALRLADMHSMNLEFVSLWVAGFFVVTRLSLWPLARLATRATHQRDLVVAATEAERARIAADVHDDALQDLTMLVRRLDAAGDQTNADAAREIAERLRAICGDLRLPVLDDLGVGPALEWLCGRQGEAAGSITLDRLAGESRLPADVELAVFRVAQEALSNAIRHGSPPILVRYRSRPDWIELEVDDSGPGLADGAAELAEQTGHLGLLNMTQRAEAVGAGLTIGRRPGGGTHVSLVWERRVAPGEAPAMAPA
jgi:signal transduction histidine kinase